MSLRNFNKPRSMIAFLNHFRRKEDGILTVEAVLVLPLLFWSMFASLTFFDGYRQSGRNLKAAYALADAISRERATINATYMDTLFQVLENMVSERSDISMRVSFVRYDKPDDRHYVSWSCIRGNHFGGGWSDANASALSPYLPVMPDNGKMIVVETSNTYVRPFRVGYGSDTLEMNNFVFTHPRVFDNINATTPC